MRCDYEQHREIATKGYSFTALLMALMRKADTENLAHLQLRWGAVWQELCARYDAPGGVIPGDPDFEAHIKRIAGARAKLTRVK